MKKNMLFITVGIGIAVGVWLAAMTMKEFKEVNTTPENIALNGFDTVAYFTLNTAQPGLPQYEYVWKDARWLFANRENMERFKANPEKFAPQFGGYCSFAVSRGYTANGDPHAWKIVGGKLYLNYSQQVKEIWEADQAGSIKQGEINWSDFKTNKPDHKR